METAFLIEGRTVDYRAWKHCLVGAAKGARPWSDRTRQELLAAGFAAGHKRGRPSLERLTPQELRVALIVAEGTSVQAAGTQLFLSPKTIESHLGRSYQKLGVHNRAQLTRIFSQQQTA